MATPFLFIIFFIFLLPTAPTATPTATPAPSPFTQKAATIRYWNRKIPNNLPHPSFLLAKLTPLSLTASTTFSNLASSDPSLLSSHLPSFCSSAALLCPSSPSPSLSSHPPNSHFASYQFSNFTNYATASAGGLSSFKNYSDNPDIAGLPADTFRRYAHHSVAHDDKFSSYEPGGNVVTANFTSYGTRAVAGADAFKAYEESTNVPDLKFSNYATGDNGRERDFARYAVKANAGHDTFNTYGKNGGFGKSVFTSYANDSNVVISTFKHYAEKGVSANDTFNSYGQNVNSPENNFDSYGTGGTFAAEKFNSYRDQANVGDNFFNSYGKGGREGTADFTNYGNSSNPGSDNFKGYGEGSAFDKVNFKEYFADNTSFKAYAKTGVDFKGYHNSSISPEKKRFVEAGKFFREGKLKKGVIMAMPDIRDGTPARSFLPRSIAGKIPFSAAAVDGIFRISPDSVMGRAVGSTVADCDRAPSRGETKRCATSAEDMIDFAVAVLGDDIEVRSTASTKGSKGNILIGNVRGVNGGKITESVSCHQSLFPYLVYYCHSVPRVRVYVAEILAVETKERINEGVAICHLDTSDWSPSHGAFVALGPGPGKIEVCHWIFEGDMTWTVADHA